MLKNQPSKRPSNLKASQRPRLGNHWAKLTFQSVPLRLSGTLRNCKKARKHWLGTLGTLGTLETGPPGRRSLPSGFCSPFPFVTPCNAFVTARTSKATNVYNGCNDVTAQDPQTHSLSLRNLNVSRNLVSDQASIAWDSLP